MAILLALCERVDREFVLEHRFAPPRRWRFDVAWPARAVALELDGATWTGGRHTSGRGFEADCEKLNAAAILGWRVVRFTTSMVVGEPGYVEETVRAALGGAGGQ